MISSLYGVIESIHDGSVVINVNGVGFLVHMPNSTISDMGHTGQETTLLTHMIVREDNISLYGFDNDTDLHIFQLLISVSGLGPKLALSMLSAFNADQICSAIANDDVNLLTTIPGIGKKTANRLVLELKEKVNSGIVSYLSTGTHQDNAEVIAALTSLGYSLAEAGKAAAGIPDKDISLEEKVKMALQSFNE